jgi:ferric-dicitrate binding protein FerR (iron transport regulator)
MALENEKTIEINDTLIARYLSGEAEPEEAIALHEWLGKQENAKYFQAFEMVWHQTYPLKTPKRIDASKAWISVNGNMQGPARSKTVFFTSTWLKIAASVIVVITAGLFFYINRTTDGERVAVLQTKESSQFFTLHDHSSVSLYRNSTLEYPLSFAGNTREVSLKGEAFFKIQPDKSKPFIIHAPAGTITVVGTSFNVVAYRDALIVSVAEGKVKLANERGAYLLEAGQEGTIDSSGNITVGKGVDMNTWSYATFEFVFNDTPLADVIDAITRSYSIQIKLSDKTIENCKLTSTFDHASVEDMISLIAETLNLTVTRDGQTFTLQGTGCP